MAMTRGDVASEGGLSSRAARRALIGSFFGTALETYDFILFGTAAGLVFNRLFFPGSDPLAGTLYAFGTLAAGFVARPFGGLIIGNYGDRVGRKPMLLLTLGLMGVVTALIGLLPTYAEIGIFAPILLTLLRVIQGIAFGGEWGGAVLVVVEHAPTDRRGLFGGLASGGIPLGTLFASGFLSLAVYATGPHFLSWGWRLPFLFSIVMIAMGLYVRTRILETPEFLALQREGRLSRLPARDVVRRHYREILLMAGAFLMSNATFYVASVFMLSYGNTSVGVGINTMLNALTVKSVTTIIATIGFGALSDRVGRVPVVLGAVIFMAFYIYPLFWLVQTGAPIAVTFGLAVAGIGIGAINGPMAAFCTEVYDASLRYSGTTLGTQIGAVFGGGLSPLIAQAMLGHFGGAVWPICVYVIVLSALALGCVMALGETYRKPRYATVG